MARDDLLKALDNAKGRSVGLFLFGEGIRTETGEYEYSIKDCKPTNSGILIDLSPQPPAGSSGYVGYTLLKIFDVKDFKWIIDQTFDIEARAVEYLRCSAYLEARSDNNMFIDFRRCERLKGDVVQYMEFNSLGQVFSRKKIRTDRNAVTIRLIPE